jgi:uncharacterized lipoprotein YddW (UPF0748 family)
MVQLTITQSTVFKRTTAQSTSLAAGDKWSVSAGQSFNAKYAYRVGKHCLVKLEQPLGSVGPVGYFFLPHVDGAVDEIRAVWLTNTDSDILASQATLQDGLQRLKALGFNTIYPVVWQRGFTLYPSDVAQAFTGLPVIPNPLFETRDMLAELLYIAQPLGMRVIPWFEYGLMAPPGSAIAIRHPTLLTHDQKGNTIWNNAVWMNPCHPDVQQFFSELAAEIAARYDIDGIQFDDHLGFPNAVGYDAFTQELYKREHWFKRVPQNHANAAWISWASQKMTVLLTQIYQAVKASRSDCFLSISPNPLGFSIRNYSADWQTWSQLGLVEELVLQVYRRSLAPFIGELNKQEVKQLRDRHPLVIGILTGLRTSSVEFSLIQDQIQQVRARELAGVSFFFYETVLHQSLSPNRVARAPEELNRLFA